jgi:tripartite-type tricarboxylate transporter receptor subunit TctC
MTSNRKIAASWAALVCLSATAGAQDYPAKSVRMIVPFSAGGGTDLIARVVAQKLTESLGATFYVDNRPGAGGTLGTAIVAKSPPDGYNLVVVSSSHGINPSVYKSLPYDTQRDLAPVSLLMSGPALLVTHPSVPARTVKELIALARAKPGALNYGSGGNGSAAHLATEYFKYLTKTNIVHVPYRGTSPAITDLLAGNISTIITGVPAQVGFIKAGRLRPLGVATAKRLPLFPELPTIAEAGVKGYEATQWYGVLAPAGTPRPVVDKLHGAIVKALQGADVRERLASEAGEPVGNTPEEFHAFIKAEIARWAPVIKASGAKPE